MRQVYMGCAKTTKAVRLAIKKSQESLKALHRKYAINAKTVAKWRKREVAKDAAIGPKNPHSTTLLLWKKQPASPFSNARLPLYDCLYALQSSIPKLTRSSLHRLSQRHGISRLPEINGNKIQKFHLKKQDHMILSEDFWIFKGVTTLDRTIEHRL